MPCWLYRPDASSLRYRRPTVVRKSWDERRDRRAGSTAERRGIWARRQQGWVEGVLEHILEGLSSSSPPSSPPSGRFELYMKICLYICIIFLPIPYLLIACKDLSGIFQNANIRRWLKSRGRRYGLVLGRRRPL